MKLKLGERYVRRDGIVTNPLQPWRDPKYPYVDPASAIIYMENGLNNMAATSGCDLVSTYETFPAPQTPPTTKAPKSEILSPGVDQIPFESLEEIGSIFAEGEIKYGLDNWKQQPDNKPYDKERTRHAIRHLMLYANGDRSENHVAKVAWWAVTTIWRNKQCHPNPDM